MTDEQKLIEELQREVAYLTERHEWYIQCLTRHAGSKYTEALRTDWLEECLRRRPEWEERSREGGKP